MKLLMKKKKNHGITQKRTFKGDQAFLQSLKLPSPTLSLSKWKQNIVTYKEDGQGSQSRQSAKRFSSRWNWDSPTPLAAGECAPPPFCPGGRSHSLAAKGVGESQFQRGDIHYGTLYIQVLCGRDPVQQNQKPSTSLLFLFFSKRHKSAERQLKNEKNICNCRFLATTHKSHHLDRRIRAHFLPASISCQN